MMSKKPARQIVKTIKEAIEEGVSKTSKSQRFVAVRNVEKMENKGWEKVISPKDKHGRRLNVNTNTDDLVLMEK